MSQNTTDNMSDNLLDQYTESKRIVRQAIDDKQLVLFVGAGASIASGMPSWNEAIQIIADRLSICNNSLDYRQRNDRMFVVKKIDDVRVN